MKLSFEELENRCCPSVASDLIANNLAAYNSASPQNISAQMASIQVAGAEQRVEFVQISGSQKAPQNIITQQLAVNQDMQNQLLESARNSGAASAQQFAASTWLQAYNNPNTTDAFKLIAAQNFANAAAAAANYMTISQQCLNVALNDYSENVTVMSYYDIENQK